MTVVVELGDVLHVAYPRACNTQQIGKNDATGLATTAQHASLKALAQLALTRNNTSNSAQESNPQTTQQPLSAEGSFVADEFDTMRTRLLVLAAAVWIDAALIRALSERELADCVALNWDDRQCLTFLRWLADTAERRRGRVPAGDTAAMYCQACGPVWIHPAIAAVLPVVAGWPRALGCPWCFVRKAGGVIPRPPVTSSECMHDSAGPVNTEPGASVCDRDPDMRYRLQEHRCEQFQPYEDSP